MPSALRTGCCELVFLGSEPQPSLLLSTLNCSPAQGPRPSVSPQAGVPYSYSAPQASCLRLAKPGSLPAKGVFGSCAPCVPSLGLLHGDSSVLHGPSCHAVEQGADTRNLFFKPRSIYNPPKTYALKSVTWKREVIGAFGQGDSSQKGKEWTSLRRQQQRVQRKEKRWWLKRAIDRRV